MKKFLAIASLVFLLTGCNQNREDEYSCRYGNSNVSSYLYVFKDRMNFYSTDYTIEKEINDKILAKEKNGTEILTFYKRTKKLKSTYKDGKSDLYDCEQLN